MIARFVIVLLVIFSVPLAAAAQGLGPGCGEQAQEHVADAADHGQHVALHDHAPDDAAIDPVSQADSPSCDCACALGSSCAAAGILGASLDGPAALMSAAFWTMGSDQPAKLALMPLSPPPISQL